MSATTQTRAAIERLAGKPFRLHQLVREANRTGQKYSETCISARWRELVYTMATDGLVMVCQREEDGRWWYYAKRAKK